MERYQRIFKENSYNDFLTGYGKKIKNAISLLHKMKGAYLKLGDEELENLDNRVLNNYDKNLPKAIDHWVNHTPSSHDIATFAISNVNRYGTEPQMVLQAVEDVANFLKVR